MKIKKIKKIKITYEVICDICGCSCKDANIGNEYASLIADWGYASKKDGAKYDIDFCENCFDETIKFLRNKRVSQHRPDPLEPNFE